MLVSFNLIGVLPKGSVFDNRKTLSQETLDAYLHYTLGYIIELQHDYYKYKAIFSVGDTIIEVVCLSRVSDYHMYSQICLANLDLSIIYSKYVRTIDTSVFLNVSNILTIYTENNILDINMFTIQNYFEYIAKFNDIVHSKYSHIHECWSYDETPLNCTYVKEVVETTVRLLEERPGSIATDMVLSDLTEELIREYLDNSSIDIRCVAHPMHRMEVGIGINQYYPPHPDMLNLRQPIETYNMQDHNLDVLIEFIIKQRTEVVTIDTNDKYNPVCKLVWDVFDANVLNRVVITKDLDEKMIIQIYDEFDHQYQPREIDLVLYMLTCTSIL